MLGQVKVDAKSNAGAAVPIDAMGCERDIANKIIAKKAAYILAQAQWTIGNGPLHDGVKVCAAA